MKPKFRCSLVGGIVIALVLASGTPTLARIKKSNTIAHDPYVGAMVIDADSGQILAADNPDAKAYPASVLKLMNLLIILDKIQAGALTLKDKVLITAEASRIGGSQVYLKENETFTIDELLYALMVQSANDAATALAIHIAGSKDGFVELMNQRARALGMKSTEFHSIHGLPPGPGQKPDITTPRDLTRLARELLNYPDTLRYTATRERGFRNNTFIMRTHNHLLGRVEGCDGMKTGYFTSAGYSIVATARRGDNRVIAVVMGSVSGRLRDTKTAELLAKGFMLMPKKPIIAPPITNPPPPAVPPVERCSAGRTWAKIGLLIAVLALIALGTTYFLRLRQRPPE
ncbi:MAG: D-alanyl-D-alanine carboxypeptidase [Verrucomicrobia bacterium]|nr:D-alanyl-D-alanine carboxypeptidase [Verrucomicrobiota bacterium]MBU1735942.1 D-alanyl-D-alanine carboxypeptidase [Verrucomicrobiota bacterium]MBU1855606.1 D-alanyl-D-alanine carboxypeptidase [Verrucomicrobiota bacterium]